MAATFELKFHTDNAAFGSGFYPDEVARIMTKIAAQVKNHSLGDNIYDSNGNKIGEWYADGPDSDDESDEDESQAA